jgi:hypothetical protein
VPRTTVATDLPVMQLVAMVKYALTKIQSTIVPLCNPANLQTYVMQQLHADATGMDDAAG